jgi:hypothetical protein
MYDGQGYGLLFKLENQPTKEKEDVVMNESSSGDDANKDKGQSKEMPTGTDSFGTEINPMPKQKQDPPRYSSPQNKQVQGCHLVDHSTPKPKQYPSMKTPENKHFLGCSLPAIKVGQIDCPRVENINAYSWSDSKISGLIPRKLWADYDTDDDELLGSPLPRVHVTPAHPPAARSAFTHTLDVVAPDVLLSSVDGLFPGCVASAGEKNKFSSEVYVADVPRLAEAEAAMETVDFVSDDDAARSHVQKLHVKVSSSNVPSAAHIQEDTNDSSTSFTGISCGIFLELETPFASSQFTQFSEQNVSSLQVNGFSNLGLQSSLRQFL